VAALNQNGPTIRQKTLVEVDLKSLTQPLAAINVGLESFTESLISQDAQVIQVDWRPPAGGDEKLMAILERMKSK
jgi:FdrA protein